MRTPLMLALAVAVGASVWATMQEDEGVALTRTDAGRSRAARSDQDAEGGAGKTARPPVATGAKPAPAPRVAAATAAAAAQGPAIQQALQQGLGRWQQRRTEAAELPPERPMTEASPSAWAAMTPPPPPPPPAPPPPPPPLPPAAPPFPHQWVGRFNDLPDDATTDTGVAQVERAVITNGAQTWVLREGDVLEGQWRVDRIRNRTMQLTYLPLMLPSSVAMK